MFPFHICPQEIALAIAALSMLDRLWCLWKHQRWSKKEK